MDNNQQARDRDDQDPEHDQDAEPSLNAPEEGRPDGVPPEVAEDASSADA